MAMATVEFENASITNANGDYDLISLLAATQKPIRLHAIFIAQISDVGDAQEEMLRLRIIRGHTTAPSGGAAPTPRPLNPSDSVSFTARTNDATIASAGTAVNLHSDAFNIRTGWVYIPTPEMRITLRPNQGAASANEYLTLRLMAAVVDDLTMSGTAYVEEL